MPEALGKPDELTAMKADSESKTSQSIQLGGRLHCVEDVCMLLNSIERST
jgi:hypothetical protein